MNELGIRQPEGAMASNRGEAIAAKEALGFPLLVRPSYVLGGRAMAICFDEDDFKAALEEALEVSEDHPVLLDRFLGGAVEYDVDILCDGDEVYVAGIRTSRKPVCTPVTRHASFRPLSSQGEPGRDDRRRHALRVAAGCGRADERSTGGP